jgi:hypothetical protein
VVIELEHLGARARLGDVFHGPAARAGEKLQRIALRRAAGHLDVALRMEQDEPPHRRHGHGPGQRQSEEPRREVDLADVDEDVLADRQAVDRPVIAPQCGLGLRPAVAEVPRVARQDFLGVLPDLG